MEQPLKDTGERCMPTLDTPWSVEHLHRYAAAMPLCSRKVVLDIASGEGYGSNLLAKVAIQVIGVDIAPDAVAHAAAKYRGHNLEFRQGRAENIPVDSSSIDVVVSFETLEHLADHDQMMREVKRVLRPGGVLIISTPDSSNYPDKRLPTEVSPDKNPFHVRELTTEEFRKLMNQHFRYCQFSGQRLVCGSLITPENSYGGIDHLNGTFGEIARSETMFNPVFRICVASDGAEHALSCSLLDGWEPLLGSAWKEARGFGRSASYRLGRAMTWPLRKLLGR